MHIVMKKKLEAYRHAVNTIDEEVEHLVKLIHRIKKFQLLLAAVIITLMVV